MTKVKNQAAADQAAAKRKIDAVLRDFQGMGFDEFLERYGFAGYPVDTDPAMTERGMPVPTVRGIIERFFSLPWRPWRRVVRRVRDIPSCGIEIRNINGIPHAVMHPTTWAHILEEREKQHTNTGAFQ